MDKQINSARNKEWGGRTRGPSCLSGALGSLVIALMFYFLSAGCQTSTPEAYWFPTSDPAWSTSEGQINRAEKFWNRQGITSYRIKVRLWTFWNDQSYSVVVRGGKVVDSSATCLEDSPGEPCPVYNFDPDRFTVPGLFAAARDKASMAKITFDPVYGFPAIISYNHTAIADEEEEWTVLEFHPESQ